LVASLTLGPEQQPLSAAIDTLHGFAYFGTYDPSGIVAAGTVFKVDLSTFTIVASLTIPFGTVSSILVESNGGFAYVGSSSSFMVAKISLASFTVVGTTSTFDHNRGAVLDTVHGFAYYAGKGGDITRVRLSDFTRDGFLYLATGNGKNIGLGYAASIDPAGGFAYFGAFYNGQVFRIRLSDFTLAETLVLPQTEKTSVQASAIDTVNGFVYFGNTASPASVFRVNLSNFEKFTTLTLGTGQNLLVGAVIDVSRGLVLFSGSGPSSGLVVEISLSTFSEVGTLTLPSGVGNSFYGATIDTGQGFAYFDFTQNTIVKIAE
jgi:hypothetical protein